MNVSEGVLVLRSAERRDAPQLTAWWNDGDVMAHAGFPLGLGQSVETTRKQIEQNERRLGQLCIVEIGGAPVGEASFWITGNEAEIGIKICRPDCQNKGYGTRVLFLLLDYLFHDEVLSQKVRIERVIWDTNRNNKRAQHVYDKIGARRIAVVENCWTDQLGVRQSRVDYEMTRDRFEKLTGR